MAVCFGPQLSKLAARISEPFVKLQNARILPKLIPKFIHTT